MELALDKLKVSWTKFDIVQTLDLLFDKETFLTFLSPPGLNSSVLKAFLGTDSLNEEDIPEYWFEILRYPIEKKMFGLFALILTHYGVIKIFKESSCGDMTGAFNLNSFSEIKMGGRKAFTNLRSCLVESGASHVMYRGREKVPYDFSIIFNNPNVGPIFRKLLIDWLNKTVVGTEIVNIDNYFLLIKKYELYKCFACDAEKFKEWLESDLLGEQKLNELLPHIGQVTIENFYSIEEMTLDFQDSQEIYFIGENGDGKTLILMAIYLAFNKTLIEEDFNQESTGKIRDILKDNPNSQLYGTDTKREILPKFINLFAYGTHRGRYSSEYYEKYGFMSLFDINQELISPEKWIKDQIIQNRNNPEEYSNIDYIKEVLHDLLDKKVNIQVKGAELVFSEKGREIKFDQLSEGFRSIIIFIIDLLYRLQKISGDNPDIFSTSAIVLVDEIDLHLHPKWKKNIVSKLRNIFKNIQFIFSTHSPTIIQGASDDAILYKVVRNKDGVTNITEKYLRKNMNHMMLNTLITSPLFDLETAKLNIKEKDYDTSDDYLLSRIHKQVQRQLNEKKKSSQKNFLSEQEVDDLIQDILSEYND